MKKICTLLLVAAMALSLIACGGQAGSNATEAETTSAPKTATVGFGRAEITPKTKIGLHGYGNVGERQSQGVHTKLYATCIALTDETDNTILLYTVDLIGLRNTLMEKFRPTVAAELGIPEGNIFAAGTHTHSGPSPDSGGTYWNDIFAPAMVEAAKAAMADRSAFTVKAGNTYTEGMNFVRHYVTDQGKVIGDNFGSVKEDGQRVKHTTEADNELQIIHFVREDKKDIVMANWQGHAKTASTGNTKTGRAMRSLLSADYIGTCREYLESGNDDLLFAFYLGASGNVNVFSDLKEEQAKNTENPEEFGQRLGDYILNAMPTLTDRVLPTTIKNAATTYAASQPSGATTDLEVRTAVFGDIAFAVAPYEMFDTDGMNVKEQSPCDITFILTVANGHVGYMPSDYAFDYVNCYEVRSTRYARGTAEAFADVLIESLNTLAGK